MPELNVTHFDERAPVDLLAFRTVSIPCWTSATKDNIPQPIWQRRCGLGLFWMVPVVLEDMDLLIFL